MTNQSLEHINLHVFFLTTFFHQILEDEWVFVMLIIFNANFAMLMWSYY